METASSTAGSTRGPADHDVRRQIVAAATKHFSIHGYKKTTVSELAKAIGFSKAYVYKFFESKQAIGAAICTNCLCQIESEVTSALAEVDSPPERLRRMFAACLDATLTLFEQDPKLYEIATSAAAENWPPVVAYEEHMMARVRGVLQQGRDSGDFERETPLDEAALGIYLVMRPYLNPLLLQYEFDRVREAFAVVSNLMLRSLTPKSDA
jgi:AcrR family transcriptional regulator